MYVFIIRACTQFLFGICKKITNNGVAGATLADNGGTFRRVVTSRRTGVARQRADI